METDRKFRSQTCAMHTRPDCGYRKLGHLGSDTTLCRRQKLQNRKRESVTVPNKHAAYAPVNFSRHLNSSYKCTFSKPDEKFGSAEVGNVSGAVAVHGRAVPVWWTESLLA